MSKKATFPEGTKEKMEILMKEVEKANELKRVQSIFLGAQGLEAKDISVIVGLKEQSIWRLWKRYRKEGEDAIFDQRGKNRGKAYWSIEEESAFLSEFRDKAKTGGIVTMKEIIKSHREKLEQDLSKGATYNLLRRHGWRKIVPRPEHPKHNPEDAERFREAIFPPGYDPYESPFGFV